MSDSRTQATRLAVSRWAKMDASTWGTGLSPEGAKLAQSLAATQINNGEFRTLSNPPKRLMIWCSANVFTAPLEWVAQFAAMGSEVVLKAPSACPDPALAMAEAFSDLGVTAHKVDLEEAFALLPNCDAVIGFGSDASMANLETHIDPNVPRSLHGHKGSLAIVKADDPDACAEGLIQDTILYDGRGCMSPLAVFCMGNAEELYNSIRKKGFQPPTSLGDISLAEKAHISRRTGIAKLLGRKVPPTPIRGRLPSEFDQEKERFHNNVKPLLLDMEEFEFLSIPRLLPIHPFFSIEDLDFLKGLPWSSCATDLPHADLAHLGFHRFCAPGELQRPPLNRKHDGVDVLARLCGDR
jgi:hypothetical protein